MRVGAIDCGTNSIRLLVGDIDTDAAAGSNTVSLSEVDRRMEIVRLGYGVDRTGVIAPESMARTLAVAGEYASQCRELGAERVRFVATSASRDARNAAEFVAGVREAFGDYDVSPEVVSGLEEAELSFRGATGDVAGLGVPGPYLVVDLGGGSTEFVRGSRDVEAAVSLDVGCVRMFERHLHSDPPTDAEIAAVSADVEAALDRAAADVGFAGLGGLVGLAGSVTTVTAHALGLSAYERERIHLARLPVEDVLAACDDLVHRTRAQRAELGFMHPGRVDVIGAGALVWSLIVRRVARDSGLREVVTSEHDILDGIALSLA